MSRSREEFPTEGGTTVTPAEFEMRRPQQKLKWNRLDTSWLISLFGTAVGAGILFLPINAGQGGAYPLIIATVLIGPMTFFAHRGLSRMVVAVRESTSDITEVSRQYFGRGAGIFTTVVYFLSIYPIILIYAVSITNTVESLMVNQLGLAPWPRWLLALILVVAMSAVMVAGPKLVSIVTGWIVYPLIAALGFLIIWLIPHWQLEGFGDIPAAGDFVFSLWTVIPVLVFAFSFAAATSQMTVSMKATYQLHAGVKATQIIKWTAVILTIFTMGFVWSSALALGPDGLEEARQANLPVVSYLANELNQPFLQLIGPAISIVAIASSFFGHWLGAIEGGVGIINNSLGGKQRGLNQKYIHYGVVGFVVVTAWLAAIINPSVLSLIESLSGPVIAMVLYLLPMYAIRKVKLLEPYRGLASNVFVTIAGIVAVSGIIFGLLP